jgi:hypothetical protein
MDDDDSDGRVQRGPSYHCSNSSSGEDQPKQQRGYGIIRDVDDDDDDDDVTGHEVEQQESHHHHHDHHSNDAMDDTGDRGSPTASSIADKDADAAYYHRNFLWYAVLFGANHATGLGM